MGRIAAALLLLGFASAAQAEVLKLAVTTSFRNSGLAERLVPEIQRDTAMEIRLLVVGTGQALRLGAAGDVDAVLTHAKAAEERFVAEGHGVHRREIMRSDFVVVGPRADPARVREAGSAAEALKRIATARTPFVSRGDDSGTHAREREIWKAAGIAPAGRWYMEVGAGMGTALNIAAGMGAYILSDRASWLNFGNAAGMAALFAGDPALANPYAYIPVSPEGRPHVRRDLAQRLEAWLVSDRARALIEGFEAGGERPFTFSAVR